MEGFGSGPGYGGWDRRQEVVVSGKSHGASQSRASRGGELKPWRFGDPESKRKKRICKYKVYAVEGKVKASLRNGLRWIKNKCSEIVRGC